MVWWIVTGEKKPIVVIDKPFDRRKDALDTIIDVKSKYNITIPLLTKNYKR